LELLGRPLADLDPATGVGTLVALADFEHRGRLLGPTRSANRPIE
jgi:hypothetical protein